MKVLSFNISIVHACITDEIKEQNTWLAFNITAHQNKIAFVKEYFPQLTTAAPASVFCRREEEKNARGV